MKPMSHTSPVTFAPGRDVLVTKPFPTGSTAPIMTTGVLVPVRLTAVIAGFHAATMTSEGRPTISAAIDSSIWSRWVPAQELGHRSWITRFTPGTYPASRKPCSNASIHGRASRGIGKLNKQPTRWIRDASLASEGEPAEERSPVHQSSLTRCSLDDLVGSQQQRLWD